MNLHDLTENSYYTNEYGIVLLNDCLYIDYRGYIFKLYFYYMPRNLEGFAETRCSIYQIEEKKHWWDKNERFLEDIPIYTKNPMFFIYDKLDFYIYAWNKFKANMKWFEKNCEVIK